MANQRKHGQFVQRTAEILRIRPADVPALLVGARSTAVRINRLAGPDAYAGTLRYLEAEVPGLRPVPWCDDTYFCPDPAAGCGPAVPLAHEGKVYLQNASSLIPVVALDARPGHAILDVAAAPGGKAFHIAARTDNEADLWLNDGVKPRLEKLRTLAALYGVRYSELTGHLAQYVDKYLPPESFDRILLDVQCSGEGRIDLRRGDALRYWSVERIEQYKFLQTKMLAAAYRLLRKGGVMVYSTCTLAPEENEFPVNQILRRHPDLDLEPIDIPESGIQPGRTDWRDLRFDRRLERAVRVVPSELFEGFFAARLVKRP
jgi:tRNA (cytosine49-C5)-methyltransferase